MIKQLDSLKLKSGETARIIRVLGPDPDWIDHIAPFLAHKGDLWHWQVRKTLHDDLSPLEAYYYLALVDDEIAGNVCTFEYGGVGILGHVFTNPTHRRKGICSSIMNHQMDDFRSRGGRAMFLGTGYDSPAYHIYMGQGFRSVYAESGFMEYYPESIDSFEAQYDVATSPAVRANGWIDWPGLTGLMSQRAGSNLRMVALHIFNRWSMEHPYLVFKRRQEETGGCSMAILESDNKLICGFSSVMPDQRFPGTFIFDLFAHPAFVDYSTEIAEACNLERIHGKLQAYAEITDQGKIEGLRKAGFTEEARFMNQMALDNGKADIIVLQRSV